MATITRPLDLTHQCELLVVGSGVAGMTAALQAARLGLDTILLEKESVLGGNSGPLLGIHWGGAHIYHEYAAETGIVMELEEEIAYRGAKHRTPDHHYNICRLAEGIWQEKLEAAGVRVLKRHVAREAETFGGRRVTAVIADDTALLQTVRIEINHAVVDASGDGQVAFSAGASFRQGRESREEFGERNAPEVADGRVAGVSITALVRRSESPLPFVPPAGSYEVPLNTRAAAWMTAGDNVRMLWPTEEGGTLLDPLRDEHEIYERLLKQFYHHWAEVKQDPAYRDWELIWVSPIAGKRETRRFVGDHMLTQTEVETPASLPDRLGYGGFTIDQHEQGADGINRIYMYSSPPLYDVSYRMTYSRDFENLYLAGRLISSTHLAHGTTRIIKTGGLLAQGTAIAVALARRHACTAREVCEKHLEELQQEFLRQDGSLLNFLANDTRNLAPSATVSASSEWRFADLEPVESVELDGTLGVVLYAWPEQLRSVRVHVSNHGSVRRPFALRVAHATEAPPALLPRPDDSAGGFFYHLFEVESQVSVTRDLADALASVPAGFTGWLEIPLSAPLDLPRRDRRFRHEGLALLLEGAHLTIARDPRPCDAAQSASLEDRGLQLSEGRLAILPDSAVPLGEASETVNGVSRRWYRAPLNMWVSAPGAALPQWLELRWPKPQSVSRVALTFDGIGRKYPDMPFNNGGHTFGPMVKDYRLEAEVEGDWRCLVCERDNFHRFRVHEIAPQTVTALRLIVEAAHDPGCGARVAEVRVE